MKTTRRSFLKYLGGLAACVVTIPSFLKYEKVETTPVTTCDYLTDQEVMVCGKNECIFTGDLICLDDEGRAFIKKPTTEFDSIYGMAINNSDSIEGKVNVLRI